MDVLSQSLCRSISMLILCFVCLTPGTAIRISIARVTGEIIAIVGSIKDWKIYVAPWGDMCQRFGPGGGELGVGGVGYREWVGSVSEVSSHPYVCAHPGAGIRYPRHLPVMCQTFFRQRKKKGGPVSSNCTFLVEQMRKKSCGVP